MYGFSYGFEDHRGKAIYFETTKADKTCEQPPQAPRLLQLLLDHFAKVHMMERPRNPRKEFPVGEILWPLMGNPPCMTKRDMLEQLG